MIIYKGQIVTVSPEYRTVEKRWPYRADKLFEVTATTMYGVDLLPEYALLTIRVPAIYLRPVRLGLMFDTIEGDS